MAEWAMAHPWMTLILGCTAFWALVECAGSITRAVALIITACSQAKAVAAAAADGAIKAEQDAEENEPLTFEELGSMNGEPVFVTARYRKLRDTYDAVYRVMEEHGVAVWSYNPEYTAKSLAAALDRKVPPEVERVRKQLEDCVSMLKKLEGGDGA